MNLGRLRKGEVLRKASPTQAMKIGSFIFKDERIPML